MAWYKTSRVLSGGSSGPKPNIALVYHNTTTGSTDFTVPSDGLYLIAAGYSEAGSASITLPTGITPVIDFTKAHARWGALVLKVAELSENDVVAISATKSDYGGIAYFKAAFKLERIEVSSVIDSAEVEDTTLSSFAPTYTGDALFIGTTWGKNDAKARDLTNPSVNDIEWASHVGLYSWLRLSYGPDVPAYSLYCLDGGAAAIAIQ